MEPVQVLAPDSAQATVIAFPKDSSTGFVCMILSFQALEGSTGKLMQKNVSFAGKKRGVLFFYQCNDPNNQGLKHGQTNLQTLSSPSCEPSTGVHLSFWGIGCFVKLGLARTPLLTTQERNRKNIDVVIEDTHVVRRNG